MFSTKKFLPVWAASCCAISRATRSVGPPGAKPTMTFTGRSGQVLAETVSAAAAVPVAAPARLAASKQDAKAKWVFISRRLLKRHQILPRLRGRVGRGPAASRLAQVAKTY